MSIAKDLSGKTFGHLKVLSKSEKRASNGEVKWLCECKCKKQVYVRTSDLKRINISCGCAIQINNVSGVNGVSWHKASSRYKAQIQHKQKTFHLGLYDTVEAAATVRKIAEENLYHIEKWHKEVFSRTKYYDERVDFE